MSERYTTDELVKFMRGGPTNRMIKEKRGDSQEPFFISCDEEVGAIIARLRAADALCAAAKDAKHELTFAPCRDNPECTSCLKCGTTEALRKATADYEEGQ